MTEYKVITLPLAEEDIVDQTDYIAFELKSPEIVVNMVRGFKKVINSLSLFPQSHELDEDEFWEFSEREDNENTIYVCRE